ncbi:GntR family transcriptional regulator [Catellatospora sp. TT07R-123]|uniref:GntR family transcriptional regulator n=1 Tax=Catellatospora sp. TT07R-123 TaxID=2733863 RepID=UPI001B1D03F9|nr:GntR family transcriptional regulator [Catellatospora sp. TT07R-123]GHJ50245.1 GntR family transcriptional regulator [Catellatospora sp. TT07R-123]
MANFSGRPAYLQIADDLRSRILDGALRGGDKLPTEAEMMADYGVSRIVVRQAIDVIRGEGLVVSQRGVGVFVRDQQPRTRRILGDLYAQRATGSPFAAAARASGQSPEWEYQSRQTTAPQAIAERLGIESGADVMRTHYRFFADNQPVMLSTSYESLDLTRGTPVEHPEAGQVKGVVARMDSIGVHITHVIEDVQARAPRPYEAEALQVPAGVPVLYVERTYFEGQRPVETADIIVSADRYTFSYAVPIPIRSTNR